MVWGEMKTDHWSNTYFAIGARDATKRTFGTCDYDDNIDDIVITNSKHEMVQHHEKIISKQ